MIPAGDTASSGEYVNVTWSTGRTPGATDPSDETQQVQDFVNGLSSFFPVSSVSVVPGDTIGLNATLWYASVTLRVSRVSDGQTYGDLLAPLQAWKTNALLIIPVEWDLENADYADSSKDNSGAAKVAQANSPGTQLKKAGDIADQAAKDAAAPLTAVAVIAVVGLAFYVLVSTGVLNLFKAPAPAA